MLIWLRRILGLDLLAAPPAPVRRGRGPGRSAVEREKAEELRWLRRLQRTNPAEYNRIMAQRAGVLPEGDRVELIAGTLKRLREAGLIDDPRAAAAAGGDGGDAWLKDVARQLGAGALEAWLRSRQSPAPSDAPEQPPPAQVGGGAPPAGALPAARVQPQEPAMSLISRYLIGELGTKMPDEAATWLLSQQHPQARQFVGVLIVTPDEKLRELLAQMASASPDLRGLTEWLQSNYAWFVATVRAVRHQAGAAGPASTS